ncbi:MAG: GIY-YIG nuclease family protein [Woeseia sp.]
MLIFDLLALENPLVTPGASKVHLATGNGSENPLDVFLAGRFSDWQQWQTRKNFERDFVISFVALPSWNQWLLAGIYRSIKSEWIEAEGMYQYHLDELLEFDGLSGRLVAEFVRSGRQSYLNAENWANDLFLSEFLRERLSIGEFPGYRMVDLSRAELEMVIRHGLESWRTALSNVAGVYLISDTDSGQLYVGSASGEGGFWQRWSDYAVTGHGGNVELRKLTEEEGLDRVQAFRYSILEITDIHMSDDDVLRRESHWKNVLLTRAHGLNAN